MARKIKMYRHDLKPDLVVACERETEIDSGIFLPVDLTDATGVRMIGVTEAGAVIFDRPVTGTSTGVVTMLWEEGDTDEVGLIKPEVEVMWPGNKPETFRPGEVINVVADYA